MLSWWLILITQTLMKAFIFFIYFHLLSFQDVKCNKSTHATFKRVNGTAIPTSTVDNKFSYNGPPHKTWRDPTQSFANICKIYFLFHEQLGHGTCPYPVDAVDCMWFEQIWECLFFMPSLQEPISNKIQKIFTILLRNKQAEVSKLSWCV